MNIAILGYNPLSINLYNLLLSKKNIIFRDYDINIKYLYGNKYDSNINIITNDYNMIIQDNDIDLIIELLDNAESFDLIKKALYSSKNVITISKDSISRHYVELQAIAIDMKVKLLCNPSLGGFPLILNSVLKTSQSDDILKIDMILNDNINNILNLMTSDGISFDVAKELLDINNNYDYLGIEDAKKLAILSMVSFNSTINVDEIYKNKIDNIPIDLIMMSNLLGYKLKYVASTYLYNSRLYSTIDLVLIKNDELLANLKNEELGIKITTKNDNIYYFGNNNISLITNSILNDIELILSGYRQKFMPKNSYICNGNKHLEARYIIKIKIENEFFNSITEKNLDRIIVTSPILSDELLNHLNEIEFYARILE